MKTQKQILEKAILPMEYDNYIFDLYGTLVDIHTEEEDPVVWEKLCLFYGYYDAHYEPEELKAAYQRLVSGKESSLKKYLEESGNSLGSSGNYAHEASPEIEITEVFQGLFLEKGVAADQTLSVHSGQFFRVLTTEYLKIYEGTAKMLEKLRGAGKGIYLLSNAQRIFTEYEMHVLGIAKYFDAILISSDYKTRKPDPRFFGLLESKLGLDLSKSIFIGNDSTTDIAGAKTVGLDTFYIKSNISPAGDAAPEADYQVADFKRWDDR